jgi:hypothetical protein
LTSAAGIVGAVDAVTLSNLVRMRCADVARRSILPDGLEQIPSRRNIERIDEQQFSDWFEASHPVDPWIGYLISNVVIQILRLVPIAPHARISLVDASIAWAQTQGLSPESRPTDPGQEPATTFEIPIYGNRTIRFDVSVFRKARLVSSEDFPAGLNFPIGPDHFAILLESGLAQAVGPNTTVEHEVREAILRALGYSQNDAHRLANLHQRKQMPLSDYASVPPHMWGFDSFDTEAVPTDGPPTGPGAESSNATAHIDALLVKFLNEESSLPKDFTDKHREVLRAFFMNAENDKSTATRLHVNEGALRVRRLRAIRALTRLWPDPQGITQDDLEARLNYFRRARITDWFAAWRTTLDSWLKNPASPPPGIITLRALRENAEAMTYMKNVLHIALPRVGRGSIVPTIDKLYGCVLEVREEGTVIPSHRYLVAGFDGYRYQPIPIKDPYHLRDLHASRSVTHIFKMACGYGPVDLHALKMNVNILAQGKNIRKRIPWAHWNGHRWKNQDLWLPAGYLSDSIVADLSDNDRSEKQKLIVLRDPVTGESVLSLTLSVDGKFVVQKDLAGRFASWQSKGARRRSARELLRFFAGQRLSPPFMEAVKVYRQNRTRLICIGGPHGYIGLPAGEDDEVQVAPYLSKTANLLLGIWRPSDNPAETPPIKAMRRVGSKWEAVFQNGRPPQVLKVLSPLPIIHATKREPPNLSFDQAA